MSQTPSISHKGLRTPKAAAVAGIIFSLLLVFIFSLFRMSMPADPLESGAWLEGHAKAIALALNLVLPTGIAFLWFVGVLRDRLGNSEDRFFATVFLGSALLFLAMLFAAAAVLGAIILAFMMNPKTFAGSDAFHLARAVGYNLVNAFAIKMAGVFMVSTSIVAFRTGFIPRWISGLGIGLAVVVLLGSNYLDWAVLLFPFWVFVASVSILMDNLSPSASRLAEEP